MIRSPIGERGIPGHFGMNPYYLGARTVLGALDISALGAIGIEQAVSTIEASSAVVAARTSSQFSSRRWCDLASDRDRMRNAGWAAAPVIKLP